MVVGNRMQVWLLTWQEGSSLVLQLFCRYLPRCIACLAERRMVFVVADNERQGCLYVLVNIEVKMEGAGVWFQCDNHF